MDAWTVLFSPDSKHVVSGSHAGKVRADDRKLCINININEHFQVNLYSVETGKKEHELDTKGVNLHLDLDSAP